MISLLTLVFLINGFSLKWTLPLGITHTKMLVADTDRDGYYELIFKHFQYPYPSCLLFCEFHPPNTWIIDSITELIDPLPEVVGDFDLDGLYDLLNRSIILESPDSSSYPNQIVWQFNHHVSPPFGVYDVDRDGFKEILVSYAHDSVGQSEIFWVYENTGDNRYELIFKTDAYCSSTHACADFDGDGKKEFAFGNLAGDCIIYESPANNTYVKEWQSYLNTGNIKDVFLTHTNSTRPKIIGKGWNTSDGSVDVFIIDSESPNDYITTQSFKFYTVSSPYYWVGISDAGDIDGDGIGEIILEASSEVFILKSTDKNDTFYVWNSLPGNAEGSCVQVTNDFDHNGINEIIISGNNYTRIYEKTPFVTWFYPTQYDTLWANDTVNLRWKLDEIISLDTLKLYWANPQLGCHLIYHGLPTDTIFQWVVPDTQSNMSNRFWLVTKGFGRYDSTHSPVFYIKRRTGVEENIPHFAFRIPHLEVYPNPFRDKTEIRFTIHDTRYKIQDVGQTFRFAIYDVTGKLVRQWDYRTIRLSDQIVLDGTDDSGQKLPPGIYFVRFDIDTTFLIQKVVKLY